MRFTSEQINEAERLSLAVERLQQLAPTYNPNDIIDSVIESVLSSYIQNLAAKVIELKTHNALISSIGAAMELGLRVGVELHKILVRDELNKLMPLDSDTAPTS